MKTVAVFAGTRPEAIKMAPVQRALERRADLRPVLVATGQHDEMLRQVLELFGLVPSHQLGVMRPNQTLASLTARLMEAIDGVLAEERIDCCLVQGDTTTAMVAALAAFYRRIPVGHVEAGLRTHDIRVPFPEELNRRIVGRIADLHFAPTETNRANLEREGVPSSRVFVTGNTVIDAMGLELDRQSGEREAALVRRRLDGLLGEAWAGTPMVLITGHRRENFGRGFEEICAAILELSRELPDHAFVYPVHLNPNVRGPVERILGAAPNVALLPPQGYAEFLALMRACRIVLTDSGGIQEEAPSLGKPVLVMRDETERTEAVEAGTVRLVGPSRERIVAGVLELARDPDAYDRMARAANPYGDGRAAERIADHLAAFLGRS